MRIELAELVQAINEDLNMIAALPEQLEVRVGALRNARTTAERIIGDLEMRQLPVAMRRQPDGTIKMFVQGHEIWRMDEANAISMRDQLDVALHTPAPDRPTDPPSRL